MTAANRRIVQAPEALILNTELSQRTKFIRAKFSNNMTSAGKILSFNKVLSHITLFPPFFYSHYVLLHPF